MARNARRTPSTIGEPIVPKFSLSAAFTQEVRVANSITIMAVLTNHTEVDPDPSQALVVRGAFDLGFQISYPTPCDGTREPRGPSDLRLIAHTAAGS